MRVVIPVVNAVWCGFNSLNEVTFFEEFIWFLKLFSGSFTVLVNLETRKRVFEWQLTEVINNVIKNIGFIAHDFVNNAKWLVFNLEIIINQVS